MPELPSAVLFCCTWNAVRSPMAEAMLKHLHGRRVFVDSVGVRQGELDPFAVAVMEEIGIDLGKHRPKTFDDLEDESREVRVHDEAVELTRTSACEVEFWPSMDPTAIEGSREVRMEAYRDLRDSIMRRILKRFPLHSAPQA